jgi:hypothetical protein
MFGKYNGFVSKARVSTCMHFLIPIHTTNLPTKDLLKMLAFFR